MKLSINIICDALPETYQYKVLGSRKDKPLDRPLLFETGTALDNNHVYVCKSESLPPQPPQRGLSLISVGGNIPQSWVNGGCQILQISNAGFFRVFNEISKIYDKYDAWETKLRDIVEAGEGFDIKNMMQVGSEMLENPIYVTDASITVRYHTKVTHDGNNHIHITAHEQSDVRHLDQIENIKAVCRVESVITVPYMSMCANKKDQAYCYNLYPFGRFAGCVSIIADHHPFKKSDFTIADFFFSLLQQGYMRYVYLQKDYHPGVAALNHVLSYLSLNAEDQQILSLRPNERWLCFRLRDRDPQKSLPISYMCAAINTLMSDFVYATIHDDAIVGLIRDDGSAEDQMKSKIDFFKDFLEKMDYIAGISNSFTDLSLIHSVLQQAYYAADRYEQNKNENILIWFHNHALSFMISNCTGMLSPECIFPEGLVKLKQHDEENQTEYIDTLCKFLENEMNASKTASDLFLHRSSLIKRMNRIFEILDVDMDDCSARLYLRICLYLMKHG